MQKEIKRIGSAGRLRTVDPKKVWALKSTGLNHREIALLLKCSYSAVGRVVWNRVGLTQ